jgi:hypothetical protein
MPGESMATTTSCVDAVTNQTEEADVVEVEDHIPGQMLTLHRNVD